MYIKLLTKRLYFLRDIYVYHTYLYHIWIFWQILMLEDT